MQNKIITGCALTFIYFLIIIIPSYSQEDSQGQSFSLSPNSLGGLQNSVNLYTGQVGFPMTVASLPGRGGLQPKVVIQYSSANINHDANTWNRESPTGLLGLGWSIDFPRIICNHNQTTTRHDDVFYLIEGGNSLELICTDFGESNNLIRSYETKMYQAWDVKYYSSEEKWVIIRDDGTKYIYGDINRDAKGTLQKMVNWPLTNWIGNSNEKDGQAEIPYIWNLSEVENLWGDKIIYNYENIEEEVGPNGGPESPKHTKASALKRITGPTGNYIEFNYQNKTYEHCTDASNFRCTDKIREYQDPHYEISEPDAYQEKYEKRYLDNLLAFDESDSKLYEVNFEYNTFIGKGEFSKRMLTGILQTNYTGTALPKTEFSYDENKNSNTYGYLTDVRNSIGGHISYNYTEAWSVANPDAISKRDLVVTPPTSSSGIYTMPEIYTGPNYVIVIWRLNPLGGAFNLPTSSPTPTYMQLFEWTGEWVKHDFGNIGSIRYSNDIDKHELVVALERGHFGLAFRQGEDQYGVRIYTKNSATGDWGSDIHNVELNDGQLSNAQYLGELFFKAGPKHFVFGALNSGKLYSFTFNGYTVNGPVWHEQLLDQSDPSEPVGYAYGGALNYVMAQNTAPDPDQFYFHYLSEDRIWKQGVSELDFDTNTLKSESNRRDFTYWYGAPSFALVMADNNPEYVVHWNASYEQEKMALFTVSDNSPVSIPSNSSLVVSQYKEGDFNDFNNVLVRRFDGKNWQSFELTGNVDIDGFDIQYRGNKLFSAAPDVIGWSNGESTIGINTFNANTNEWEEENYTTPESWLDRFVKVSETSALMGDQFYYREPDNHWLNLGTLDTYYLNGDSWRDDLRQSSDKFYISRPYNSSTTIYWTENGKLDSTPLNKNMDKRKKYYDVGERLVGGDIFIAFDPDQYEKYNADKLYLYKWSNGVFKGRHHPIVVRRVNVNDGNLLISKSYQYDLANAKMDGSGHLPLFNEVKVVNGIDPTVTPKGYTRHYFYNGKSKSELANVPAEQIEDPALLLAGSSYLIEMYDAQNNLVSSTKTVYDVTYRDVVNSQQTVIDQSYRLRPIGAYTYEYLPGGTRSIYTKTAYNEYGFPTTIDRYSSSSSLQAEEKSTVKYKYYPDEYSIDNCHIISEIIGTTQFSNDMPLSSSVTVWKEDNGIPSASKNYSWRGDGITYFGYWDGSAPNYNWRLSNEIDQRDVKGNILESHNYLDDYESAIYDDLMRNPIASSSYAKVDQIAATSFEVGQMGPITASSISSEESYTGTQSLYNGTAQVPGLAAGEYVVYYWYMDEEDSGTISVTNGTVEDLGDMQTTLPWKLRKWKVNLSGTGVVTLSTTGYADELRIHPETAYMTTYVYDEKQQKTAETGSNMLTTFFYYDDLNRQHYITDHNGDITVYYEYGFKNFD